MNGDFSAELLRPLERQERTARHDIITVAESWSYFCRDHELIWLARADNIAERGRYTIQSPTMMVTIA
jgi:hypothetical protein